jgi:hypothetical protein
LLIRILKQPDPHRCEPFALTGFLVGEVYEVDTTLAELLIVEGFADIELTQSNAPPGSGEPAMGLRDFDDGGS